MIVRFRDEINVSDSQRGFSSFFSPINLAIIDIAFYNGSFLVDEGRGNSCTNFIFNFQLLNIFLRNLFLATHITILFISFEECVTRLLYEGAERKAPFRNSFRTLNLKVMVRGTVSGGSGIFSG